MKILLVSDSHGDDESLRKIANKHNNCDYYIHLGDSQSSPDLIRPFVSVRGNCDYYSSKFMDQDKPLRVIHNNVEGLVTLANINVYVNGQCTVAAGENSLHLFNKVKFAKVIDEETEELINVRLFEYQPIYSPLITQFSQ